MCKSIEAKSSLKLNALKEVNDLGSKMEKLN